MRPAATRHHRDDPIVQPIEKPSWTEEYRLKAAVGGALEMLTTRDGRALDIQCGDGSLLAAYPRWIRPVGIDPRLGVTGAKDWGYGIAGAFLSDDVQDALVGVAGDGFDIITAINQLEECDAPLSFLHHAKSFLAPDGLIVLETSYAALVLTRTLSSAFYRDARAVYSLASIEDLVRRAGYVSCADR